jgi:hypothetical protein
MLQRKEKNGEKKRAKCYLRSGYASEEVERLTAKGTKKNG